VTVVNILAEADQLLNAEANRPADAERTLLLQRASVLIERAKIILMQSSPTAPVDAAEDREMPLAEKIAAALLADLREVGGWNHHVELGPRPKIIPSPDGRGLLIIGDPALPHSGDLPAWWTPIANYRAAGWRVQIQSRAHCPGKDGGGDHHHYKSWQVDREIQIPFCKYCAYIP
jgi:hypothetical protein